MTDYALTPAPSRAELLQAAEVDYCAGILSVNAVAHKHGIPESTLRREAKHRGWLRVSPDARRDTVAAALVGASVANQMTNEQISQAQSDAANQDIDDMNRGLAVSRRVLEKLATVTDHADDPRDLKVIMEATRAAIETIRKIRSLDAPPPPPVTQVTSMNVTAGWDELQAAFDRVLGRGHYSRRD